ncbi:MAG: hypothetical protein JO227_13915 [Acetobacteraceae bacterium]|nr:hypothetical protein [Acetobacteraceae bacterium]
MGELAEPSREEVEAAVVAEAERIGPDGFDKAAVVKKFLGRGVSRATLYRWVDAVLATGKPGAAVVQKVKAAAKERAARTSDPAEDAAAEAVEKLPAVVKVEDITGTHGPIPVIEKLGQCVRIAEKLIKHAETPEGGVRNAKLLLTASEHLRRTLETTVRLHEAIMDTVQVERFHEAVFNVLRRKDPMLVEEVLAELRALNAQWGLG